MALPPRIRLLVIAADRELRDEIATLALQHGYDVLAAANAIETIDLLETSARPHVAVVDPRAPGVLGRSVMDYVRDDVRLRSIPLTVLAAPFRSTQVLELLTSSSGTYPPASPHRSRDR
jgi:CheY-like chemotaxis protein